MPRFNLHILHQGFENQGEAGKTAWTIARSGIAVAMAQDASWRGSFKMQSQIQFEPEQDKV